MLAYVLHAQASSHMPLQKQILALKDVQKECSQAQNLDQFESPSQAMVYLQCRA